MSDITGGTGMISAGRLQHEELLGLFVAALQVDLLVTVLWVHTLSV